MEYDAESLYQRSGGTLRVASAAKFGARVQVALGTERALARRLTCCVLDRPTVAGFAKQFPIRSYICWVDPLPRQPTRSVQHGCIWRGNISHIFNFVRLSTFSNCSAYAVTNFLELSTLYAESWPPRGNVAASSPCCIPGVDRDSRKPVR